VFLLTKEILYNSLAQAVIAIILTPHFLIKLLLTVCVLSSTSLASYLVIQSIMEYFTYGVTTTSRTIFETPTLFPKVTFCNVNKYTTQYAFTYLQTKSHIMKDDYEYNISDEQKKKLGHDLKDILIECKFNGNLCNPNDFSWSFDPKYYNCYTFNSGYDSSNGTITSLKQSTISGSDFGPQLTLYVNILDKFSIHNWFKEIGAVIRIGNSSYKTYYSNGDGILLSPGLKTNIVVEREFKSILPKPYSNCEIDSNYLLPQSNLEFYNLIDQSGYEYTRQLCFIQCYKNFIIKKYNCSHPSLLSLFNVSNCDLNANQFNSTDVSLSINLIN
jgi:hypothetical protein